MIQQEIHIGTAKFKNPVTVASGTFAFIEKYSRREKIRKLGALIPKTVTLRARHGNPPARIAETPAGMLNAIGLENAGADDFIQNKLPVYQSLGAPLIISFSADTDEDFLELAQKFQGCRGVAALELNLSCPNLRKKILVAQDAAATGRVVAGVKKVSRLPVIAKLSPNVTDIGEIALAAQEAGADGLSLVNTFSAMAVDVETRRPVLGNVSGGLSGPAIRPIALYMVREAACRVRIPIIAMGGIMETRDALEFLIAGASMVAVGTANFVNLDAPWEICDGITAYLKRHKMKNIQELIGSLRTEEGGT